MNWDLQEETDPRVVARSIRRYTMCFLAVLGYVPWYLPARAKRRAVATLRAAGRRPIYLTITRKQTVRMARVVAEAVIEAKLTRTNDLRRQVIALSAVFAVAVYRHIAGVTAPANGTAAALLTALRFANENASGFPAEEASRARCTAADALAAVADADTERGADDLAAVLRNLYRVQTIQDRMAVWRRWVAEVVALAASFFA